MESSLGWEREEGESLLPKSTASLLPQLPGAGSGISVTDMHLCPGLISPLRTGLSRPDLECSALKALPRPLPGYKLVQQS